MIQKNTMYLSIQNIIYSGNYISLDDLDYLINYKDYAINGNSITFDLKMV